MRKSRLFLLFIFSLQFALASVQNFSVDVHDHNDCCCSVDSCICPDATSVNVFLPILNEFSSFVFVNELQETVDLAVIYYSSSFLEENKNKRFKALEFHSFFSSLDSCVQKSSYLI